MAGRFITFEGGEGSGKSTQIKLLAEELIKAGRDVLTTREPGGTAEGVKIREILVTGNADFTRTTETLLFFADRCEHVMKKIMPAVKAGQIVLCDRFADSTMAYQGYGYGDNPDQQQLIKSLYKEVVGDFKPDLTILLDVPVETGLSRSRRADNIEVRFENKELAFHERLRQAYLKMANDEPERFAIVDATQPIPEIHDQIMKIIEQRGLLKAEKV
ncbi:MAG: dTMP kinase [Alphaproteobacteria bacterium]|nr:dTMP kinase [Alphaproteobacteria bacterium]